MVSDGSDRPREKKGKTFPAFDDLYQKYRSAVFGFAFYLTQNQDEAEDLFQDTWLRVLKNLEKIDMKQNTKAWIFTITANLHRDMLRKKRIRRLFLLEKSASPPGRSGLSPGQNGAGGMDPSGAMDHAAMVKTLSEALARLPRRQRSVFMLKEIERFKYAEISAIMNLPVGTVKSLMYRAFKRLQGELSVFRP